LANPQEKFELTIKQIDNSPLTSLLNIKLTELSVFFSKLN